MSAARSASRPARDVLDLEVGLEEQKQRWLPAMHAGEAIGCFGLTEPDAGSDPGSMRTTARRDGSDWILNGAKMWITNGTIADVATVWARTEDGKINGFLVEGHARLQRAGDPQEALAPRLGDLGARPRRRARAGGEPPGGRPAARAALLPERGSLRDRLGAVGAGRACFEAALEYAKRSGSFSRSRSPATS